MFNLCRQGVIWIEFKTRAQRTHTQKETDQNENETPHRPRQREPKKSAYPYVEDGVVGHQHVGPLELGAVARGVRDEAVADVAVVEVHALRWLVVGGCG